MQQNWWLVAAKLHTTLANKHTRISTHSHSHTDTHTDTHTHTYTHTHTHIHIHTYTHTHTQTHTYTHTRTLTLTHSHIYTRTRAGVIEEGQAVTVELETTCSLAPTNNLPNPTHTHTVGHVVGGERDNSVGEQHFGGGMSRRAPPQPPEKEVEAPSCVGIEGGEAPFEI